MTLLAPALLSPSRPATRPATVGAAQPEAFGSTLDAAVRGQDRSSAQTSASSGDAGHPADVDGSEERMRGLPAAPDDAAAPTLDPAAALATARFGFAAATAADSAASEAPAASEHAASGPAAAESAAPTEPAAPTDPSPTDAPRAGTSPDASATTDAGIAPATIASATAAQDPAPEAPATAVPAASATASRVAGGAAPTAGAAPAGGASNGAPVAEGGAPASTQRIPSPHTADGASESTADGAERAGATAASAVAPATPATRATSAAPPTPAGIESAAATPTTAATAPLAIPAIAPQTALPAAVAAAPPAPAAPVDPTAFRAQLRGPVLAIAATEGGDSMVTLTVQPERLGPVTVRALIGADGQLRVELFAPNDAGREALRTIAGDLRRDLADTGAGARLDVSSDDAPGRGARDGRDDPLRDGQQREGDARERMGERGTAADPRRAEQAADPVPAAAPGSRAAHPLTTIDLLV